MLKICKNSRGHNAAQGDKSHRASTDVLAGGKLQPTMAGNMEGACKAVEAEIQHLRTWSSWEPIKEKRQTPVVLVQCLVHQNRNIKATLSICYTIWKCIAVLEASHLWGGVAWVSVHNIIAGLASTGDGSPATPESPRWLHSTVITQHCWFCKQLLFHSEWNGLILPCHRDSILKQTSITKAAINGSITKKRVSACNYIFLLTTSGRGIPAFALRSLDLFPLPCTLFQQVPSPNLLYIFPWACWTCLPAPAAISTGWCLSGWHPAFLHFSGMQEGKGKKAEMTHKEDKRIVHVFHTHFAWQLLTSSGCPKASNPERGGSLCKPDKPRVCCLAKQQRIMIYVIFLYIWKRNILNRA